LIIPSHAHDIEFLDQRRFKLLCPPRFFSGVLDLVLLLPEAPAQRLGEITWNVFLKYAPTWPATRPLFDRNSDP